MYGLVEKYKKSVLNIIHFIYLRLHENLAYTIIIKLYRVSFGEGAKKLLRKRKVNNNI